MQYALTLPADGTRWPIKWFPTEADERQAHVLENISGANERQRPLSDIRVGAYCIRPPCSWPRTIAPDRYPPQSENISGANERQAPLSDVRVGAYCIRPPMFMAENNSTGQVSAAIGKHFGGEWIAVARKMVSDGSESAFWGPIRFQVISK